MIKKRSRTDYIIVHCADTYENMDIGVDDIRRWHVDERGWIDVGYHYVIRRDGTIETGRPEHTVGSHVEGKNSVSIGICLVGGKPEFNFTDVQMSELRNLLNILLEDYPNAVVAGHNDFAPRRCPTFKVKEWYYDDNLIYV